jgi:hypothetical protein
MAVNHDNSDSACPMNMAERELGAFITVVTELYGPDQARISAADWLDELESTERIIGSTSRELRFITIAAAVRLATRLAEAACHTQRAEASVAEPSAFC